MKFGSFWYQEPKEAATWFRYQLLANEEGSGSSRYFQIRFFATWDELSDDGKSSIPNSSLCAVYNILTVRISQDGNILNSDGTVKPPKEEEN